MNQNARRIAVSAAAAAVTLSVAAPAAVAHDRGGSYDGRRDGYSSGYGGDRSSHDGDHQGDGGGYGDRERDGDHFGDHTYRYGHDRESYKGDATDHDRDKAGTEHSDADKADGRVSLSDGFGHTRRDSGRGDRAKTGPSSPVAFAQQQRAMFVYLDRASSFLDQLSARISSSDLDPTLKSTLLGLIESRKTRIATLTQQVQAATTLRDLRELRHDGTDAHA